MKVVTGGAGFIGSNIVKGLNEIGVDDILVVDDLRDGTKFKNIVDCNIVDYIDHQDFINKIINREKFAASLEVFFHEGACSDTTEWNGLYMMKNNYEYSKHLLHYCLQHKIPYLYASSAATYGSNETFKEDPAYEAPLNIYGYSKLLFDQYVRRILPSAESQVVGCRYFNVYGPRELHKGKMASVAYHFNQQIMQNGVAKLFSGTDGYGDGEQLRDFVFVKDVVAVNLWFWQQQAASGIYNIGTGRCQTFNDVANAVIKWHAKGTIEYMQFPGELRGRYQNYTQADISALRHAGYTTEFKTVEQGVKEYLDWLNKFSG